MATTVNGGFCDFLTRLTPNATESEAAKKHRTSIEECLKNNFGVSNFFRSGSFGNGTSIRGFSDVDYFASIPIAHQNTNSITMLTKVRDALDKRFPNSGVCVRTPAVVVPFGTDASETTEVVPAKYSKQVNGKNVYDIANGLGGWIQSSPSTHSDYLAGVNGKLSNKVKPLIRFLKAWKYYRNVPVSSFYLEMRVAKYASGESTIIYSIDVRNVLKLLVDNSLASIQDPCGISGLIPACASQSQKEDALSKLNTALTRADNAREAELADKIKDAFYWWGLVFDGHFPAYG